MSSVFHGGSRSLLWCHRFLLTQAVLPSASSGLPYIAFLSKLVALPKMLAVYHFTIQREESSSHGYLREIASWPYRQAPHRVHAF